LPQVWELPKSPFEPYFEGAVRAISELVMPIGSNTGCPLSGIQHLLSLELLPRMRAFARALANVTIPSGSATALIHFPAEAPPGSTGSQPSTRPASLPADDYHSRLGTLSGLLNKINVRLLGCRTAEERQGALRAAMLLLGKPEEFVVLIEAPLRQQVQAVAPAGFHAAVLCREMARQNVHTLEFLIRCARTSRGKVQLI
jgi:hypothetical protein